jgi:inhibitor of KinA
MMLSFPYTIQSLGDSALLLDFGNTIDKDINQYVLRLFYHFKRKTNSFILDIVPAYSSLSFHYNIAQIRQTNTIKTAFETLKEFIEEELEHISEVAPTEMRTITIPVCYSGAFAPDITLISSVKNISVEEIIRVHTETTYTIYMIGFLPGFPYLGSVDEAIAFPRKQQPRAQVPAGSVGIASQQTGIYPMESPGGWQIIGRTPLKIFDNKKENPVALQPGDQVKFYSITEDEFKNY